MPEKADWNEPEHKDPAGPEPVVLVENEQQEDQNGDDQRP